MSDSIQPIRYTPPISRLNPKDRTGGKKEKQNFQDHISANNKETKTWEHNQEEERDENPAQTEDNSGLDETCGTILDSEI